MCPLIRGHATKQLTGDRTRRSRYRRVYANRVARPRPRNTPSVPPRAAGLARALALVWCPIPRLCQTLPADATRNRGCEEHGAHVRSWLPYSCEEYAPAPLGILLDVNRAPSLWALPTYVKNAVASRPTTVSTTAYGNAIHTILRYEIRTSGASDEVSKKTGTRPGRSGSRRSRCWFPRSPQSRGARTAHATAHRLRSRAAPHPCRPWRRTHSLIAERAPLAA